MLKRTLAIALLGIVAARAPAQDTFHANAARTGVYPSAGPTSTPAVKWTFKAAGPIVTSPAIAGNVVYIGSLSGHLYAIDKATGQEKWNFKSRMPIASSPSVADGTVYFASQYAHRLMAITRDGALRVVAGTGSSGTAGDGWSPECSVPTPKAR